METLRELHDDGMLSSRVYNCVRRGIYDYFSNMLSDKLAARRISNDLSEHITAKALFEMFGEDRIRDFKHMGTKGFEHLKGLL